MEIEFVKNKNVNNPNKLENALKELNKFQVVNKILHENKNWIIGDYTGDFEMIVGLKVGDQLRQQHIRFRNKVNYEDYINSIDEGYEAEDAIFIGYLHKIITPQFNFVNRSQYAIGCNFEHQFHEYRGNNCDVPSNGYCFIKCINLLTGEDYKRKYVDFIKNEQRL